MKAFGPFLFFFILCYQVIFAQQHPSTLQGTITNDKNEPLEGVTVAVNNRLTTKSNDQGKFALSFPPGTYQLTFRFVGYNTEQVSVEIFQDVSKELTIALSPTNETLQSVEVIGRKESSYKNTNSFSGTKTATPIKEIPQSISYVTKETLDDQLAFKTSDAIKNVSGVNQYSYNNNDFVLRGFRASNTLVNGLRISTRGWAQNLLPYVERIEVIKGPASALFANTDPGGTINTVTKKPLDETRRSINFTTGSYNTYRTTLDFTGPLTENKNLLYRLNLAYQNAESFRMLQDGTAMVIAPSFSFIPNERTRINFDLVYQYNKGRLDRGQPIFGASQGTDLYSTPTSFAIGRKNDYQKELNLFSTISLQHQFTDNISFNASYLKSYYDEDLLEHRTSNNYGVDKEGNQIPTLMGMQTIRRLRKNYIDNLTTYFNFNFNTGPLAHKLLVGYDYIQEVFPKGNSTYNANGFLSRDGKSTISTYKPADSAKYMIVNNMPVPNVPYFNLANPDYSISEISNYLNVSREETPTKYYVNGIYLQEQLKWGKWQALLGFRQEFYTDILNYTKENEEKVEQKAFIPRVGLVYTPLEPVSFYATYTEGYQPQSAGTIGDPETYGGPFDPLISNMIEAGAKMEFFHKNLAINTAFYRIEQNNILVNANAEGNPDLLRQIGQQQAKGIELDIYGNVHPNFSVTANFSYNVAKITKSDDAEEVGTIMPNAPKSQGNLWMKYAFTGQTLEGFALALGANYATRRNTDTDILKLPAYWVANAALFYRIDKFKLSVNMNNLLNKVYWVGGFDYVRLFPGAPRNYMLSLGYTF
ncbi:TonB-dependent receptor [Olivibacter domesticus]|uniref:Iron complex outermembrane recepter protein n=1 Tax=Olivibacter domesticus TaxID=407022 RepID=A0A1H7URL4_OLID1|nr:TonB-dependent receptor [Olivibacter domesticus]SEL99456.1 iron complex outermembrane recepter protein [Olivibacter domesticus]